MTNIISNNAIIATTPRHMVTSEGVAITSFRIAEGTETSRNTPHNNWFTVVAFDNLAVKLMAQVNKGDHIDVVGNLIMREWSNGSASGVSVEIELLSFEVVRVSPITGKRVHKCTCRYCGI